MSLTERERRNPPPRQKACAACIKAKRRCDAALPACLRCAQRGIPCVMPARQRSSRSSTAAAAAAAASTPITTIPFPTAAAPPTPPSTYDFGEFIDTTFPLLPRPCSNDWDALLSSLDPALTTRGLDAVTLATSDDLLLPRPLEATIHPEVLGLVHQQSTMAAPTSRDFERLPEAVSKKLAYALDEIKKAPAMMVLETQTPWCHPKLYEEEMPRSMQDAHAACALYMAKNRTNTPVILRSIENRVDDLLQGPPPVTPLEILAHTQALILYHIIRVFDGDIGARASADRTQSALEDIALSLVLHTDFNCPSPAKLAAAAPASGSTAGLPLYPLGPTKRFWREWVFQESSRRTLLFTFLFLQAYRVISRQPIEACDGKLNRCHGFTLSASLWEADGPLAFARAWGRDRHLVVENTDFRGVLGEARADEVDAFGKIIFTSVIGVDEAEGWFADRGGSLRPVS